MVKKLLMALACTFVLGGTEISANTQSSPIGLEVRKVDNHPTQHGGAKNPIEFPTVSQDGHTIEIDIPHPEYVLNIVDSNDNVFYTVVVPSNVSEVDLPDTLSGTYELQLIQGNWCFYGDITL